MSVAVRFQTLTQLFSNLSVVIEGQPERSILQAIAEEMEALGDELAVTGTVELLGFDSQSELNEFAVARAGAVDGRPLMVPVDTWEVNP